MKLAVISDLHLGRGDVTDRFGDNDDKFIKFLSFLEDNFEKIILLGDVYETLFAPFSRSFEEEFALAREIHKKVADRLDGKKYIQLHGNHDLILAKIKGAPLELNLSLGGLKFHFTHGHLYSWLNRGGLFFAENGSRVGAAVKRSGLNNLYNTLEAIFSTHGKSGRPEKGKYLNWALKLAREREADVIVTAHTHQGGITEKGDQIYMNSGNCMGGKFSFLSIDAAKAAFSFEQSWQL